MSTDPGSSTEPTKLGQKFKITLLQGIIGAASLAGTTAIPILVQRYLPPAPAASPSPTASPQVTPAQIQPANSQVTPSPLPNDEQEPDKKGKKKSKH